MKTITKRFLSVVLVVLSFGFTGVLTPLTAQAASTPQVITPAAAAVEKFDGPTLYKAAFEAIRDNHILLADQAAREKWAAEWEHKFDKTKQLATEKSTDEAILQMMQSLGQRFDYFFDVDATKAEQEEVSAALVGIGATLKLKNIEDIIKSLPKGATKADAEAAMKVSAGHELMIEQPMEGGPAAQYLKPGDVIVKVDGKAIDGMLMKDAISLIRGKENTDVEITVARTDDAGKTTELTFKITRKKVTVKVVHTKDLGNGISYIKLDNFMSQNATRELAEALTKAANGKGIILDLRNNPGGSLNAVLTMATYMLPEGTILVTHVRDGDQVVDQTVIAQKQFIIKMGPDDKDPSKTSVSIGDRPKLIVPENMPIVVLVNENSASASEILSGVLQHHKRAVIVGKPSHGKGVGQNVIDLPFGRRLHVTTFEFLPGGAKMDWIGIIPEVDVDQATDNGKTDNQLDAAVSQIKQLITAKDGKDQKAQELDKKNHEEFQKTLDKRSPKP